MLHGVNKSKGLFFNAILTTFELSVIFKASVRAVKVSSSLKPNHHIIVKIDSITQSFCLSNYVQNGLSYSGKETQPTLCLKGRQARLGIVSLGTNKDQLLHRIHSVWAFTNLQ